MKLTQAMLVQMTPQQVFDSVVYPLIAQNARATGDDGVRCMYRAPDGRRCAIGWVMPDDVYHKTLEFMGIRHIAPQLLNTNYGDAYARFLYRHMDLLRALQDMHDARYPEEWPRCLRAIAKQHGLDPIAVSRALCMCGRRDIEPKPVITYRAAPPAYLLNLANAPFYGVDHGVEEREEAREVCSA
jgi:hypothetical protein